MSHMKSAMKSHVQDVMVIMKIVLMENANVMVSGVSGQNGLHVM